MIKSFGDDSIVEGGMLILFVEVKGICVDVDLNIEEDMNKDL